MVTGGAGFIGSHVCDALLGKGVKVICVDNFNDYYDPELKERNISEASNNDDFTLCRVDITDSDAIREVFSDHRPDKVIHLAARAGVRASFEDPELYRKVNVDGTKNLLELSKEFNVKNFVFGSSSSVYGTNEKIPFSEDDLIDNAISPYAETKKEAESLCKEYADSSDLKITCLRLFTVYGPRGRVDMAPYKFTKNILNGEPIEMYGDGTTKRDYTYVMDIVDGILSASEREGDFEIINLGDSNPIELKEFIAVIEKETGKKAIINNVPMQRGDVPMTYADISKAKELLGYEPKVNIEQGIKLLVEWLNG